MLNSVYYGERTVAARLKVVDHGGKKQCKNLQLAAGRKRGLSGQKLMVWDDEEDNILITHWTTLRWKTEGDLERFELE